jgi:uncharacterized SAM-binding protein YcdF (DUF218 family)
VTLDNPFFCGDSVAVKRLGKRLIFLLISLVILTGAALWAFRNVGQWLVINDPLQPARAIVVLSGITPYRAMEAAEIYKQGWAPEVWLFRDDPRGAHEAFLRLGIHHIPEEEYDEQVLEQLGVPKTAIRTMDIPTTNTQNEFALLKEELARQAGNRVILVTSPLHTRRSKAIWNILVGDRPQAIVRFDASEPTNPDHWWRSTQDVQDVEHEVLGLIDAHLGFVAKPMTR